MEARHGVDIGASYTNKAAATTFCHYIAQSRRLELMNTLSKAKFFSVLMDGSTDKRNVDDELFLVTHCDIDGLDERVHTQMDFLCVHRPATVTAAGLLSCLESALQCLGI